MKPLSKAEQKRFAAQSYLENFCGYGPIRWLPEDRWAATHRFMFTEAIIVGCLETVLYGYDDRWCFEPGSAAAALEAWSGEGEPEGWHRHPDSGRRRPNGDKAREYVAR